MASHCGAYVRRTSKLHPRTRQIFLMSQMHVFPEKDFSQDAPAALRAFEGALIELHKKYPFLKSCSVQSDNGIHA